MSVAIIDLDTQTDVAVDLPKTWSTTAETTTEMSLADDESEIRLRTRDGEWFIDIKAMRLTSAGTATYEGSRLGSLGHVTGDTNTYEHLAYDIRNSRDGRQYTFVKNEDDDDDYWLNRGVLTLSALQPSQQPWKLENEDEGGSEASAGQRRILLELPHPQD